jgi:REP element-mobilizing transposase RayT
MKWVMYAFPFGALRYANTPYTCLIFAGYFMPDYRRAFCPGGTFFFTVNLLQRRNNPLLIRHVDVLRTVVREVRHHHPFHIHGWVVLPEHVHAILELPPGDADFSMRWRLIKSARVGRNSLA